MIVTLSPAKTLDLDKTIPYSKTSQPQFLEDTKKLVGVLKKKSPGELEELMGISESLATLNFARYKEWKTPFTEDNARPAVFTFDGPVYRGFDWLAYKDKDYERLQKTVRLLSGLHGLLRPLDLIQPYRLDMHTPLKNHGGNDLYALWKDKVTEAINKECKDILINCASKEYSEAIDWSKIKATVVETQFKQNKKGKFMVMGLFAKKARGMFADFVVRNNYSKIKDLQKFSRGGYVFDDKTSTDTNLVFLKKA